MCNALGIEPILTTTSSSSPSDLADLVEYCHGDAKTTRLGRRRSADGHPKPYRVVTFELGNEQYNHQFVQQVAAMEARAAALGMNGTLRYIFPDNGGLRGTDVEAAKKLGIDAQIAADIHVGAGGGVGVAEALLRARTDFHQSAVNFETNAGTHTHQRALQEASDLNAFFAAPAEIQRRLLVRTASFCMERSGHFDMFDQGIAFFLPNMTWLQPPGHVHAMIAASKLPRARRVRLLVDELARAASVTAARKVVARKVAARKLGSHGMGDSSGSIPASSRNGVDGDGFGGGNVGGGDGSFSVSAQSSDDDSKHVVRLVNPFASPIGPGGLHNLSLELRIVRPTAEGEGTARGQTGRRTRAVSCDACTFTSLSAPDPSLANPSWLPELISPKRMECEIGVVSGGEGDGMLMSVRVPLASFSYNVIELSGCSK